jgi:hypothetical protein
MKKAIFKRLDNSEICHRIEEDPTAYIEQCAAANHWGKSIRWVRERIQVPSIENPQVLVDSYPDEEYAPEDVLDSRIDIKILVPEVIDQETQDVITPAVTESINMVQLRATYTVEIIDLSVDPTYLLEQCYKNRKAAYPTITDFADAYYHSQNGNNAPMTEWLAAQEAVKVQFPKP